MSFRVFIYYCALCGGWAAFLVWAIVQLAGVNRFNNEFVRVGIIGGLLGGLVAAAVGFIDALLNATGFQRVWRILVCGGLGFAGGAIGGLVGQVLATYLRAPLVVGWVLAGILIGASIGAFDLLQALFSGRGATGSFRKMRNGVYGGLLGGLIGGLPYTFLIHSPTLQNSGLTIGLVLLGGAIGLMIGLAQVILKEAWLTVEDGFRAGRELLLTKDETTIGRSESCDLGLFGDSSVARVHARILVKNHRYFIAHAAVEGETLVNEEPVGDKPRTLRSGDLLRIGKCVLRFGERHKRK
jgi:hypothetical protein